MNLVTAVVGLPLAPVRGLLAVARLLRDEAERELYDPTRLRRQLEDVRDAVASGELSPEEGERAEREIVGRLTAVPPD
jgi:chorismate mutase